MGQYQSSVWMQVVNNYTGCLVWVLITTREQEVLKYRYESLLQARQEKKGSAHNNNMSAKQIISNTKYTLQIGLSNSQGQGLTTFVCSSC
jgi:hypothetical protein